MLHPLRSLLALLPLAGLSACTGKDGTGDTVSATDDGSVDGYVFKGPMLDGSPVQIQPLDEEGQPEGDPVETSVLAADGSYEAAGLPRGLVMVEASGTILNEAQGDLDPAMVTMFALAEVGGETQDLHVNLLTDLTHPRIAELMSEGLPFQDARAQAEGELKAALPIGSGATPTELGEAVDPYGEGFDAQWLFAFSSVTAQAGIDLENAGLDTLPDLLEKIRGDLADDGELNEDLAGAYYIAEENLNPDLATTSIDTHIDENELTVKWPDLHTALDSDHDGITNDQDNCRYLANPDQEPADGGDFGAACDYRLGSVSTTDEWGCGVLAADGSLSCWQVALPPLGGSPPRPDEFPTAPGAPWGLEPGLEGADYTDVALGDGVACATAAEGVECWIEGEGTELVLSGEFRDALVSPGLICGLTESDEIICHNRASRAGLELTGPYEDFALLGDAALCAIRASDGGIDCRDETGEVTTPVGLPTIGQFARIDATTTSAGWGCAVAATGEIACFGSSPLALGAPTGGDYGDVVVGEAVACAVASEGGEMTCWREEALCPEVGEPPIGVMDLSAGTCQVCGIDPTGLGTCWPLYWDTQHPLP